MGSMFFRKIRALRKLKPKSLRPVILSYFIMVFLLGLTAGTMVIWENLQRDNIQRDNKLETLDALSIVRSRLESLLKSNFYQLGALEAYISVNPQINEDEFNLFSRNLFRHNTYIKRINAMPDMVVRYVYPLQGNEEILGLDYNQVPDQREAAYRARESGQTIVSGPLYSVQGDYVLIARAPVYLAEDVGDKKSGSFWGLISVVIDVKSVFEEAGLWDTQYRIAIRGRNEYGETGTVFFGEEAVFDNPSSVLLIDLPGESWQIAAVGKSLDDTLPLSILIIRLVGSGACLFIIVFTLLRVRYLRERMRNRSQLERALIEAEQSSRVKSEFLANMSHELRTPLNAIIGFSDLLMSKSQARLSEEKCTEYAQDINQSGKHLLDIINDILDLSKVESGKFMTHIEAIAIQEILDHCMRLTREAARSGSLSLVNDIPEELPLLLADGRMIKQILINLMSNAIKFTPAGGRVVISGCIKPSGALEIKVSDTGIGMAKEDIDMALQPFGQIGSYLVRRQQGTGLGLPLVKGFVELLGGEFHIFSTIEEGTEVSITFPAELVTKDED